MNDNARMEAYVHMSRAAGARSDYVQGGGGNTSVKLSEGRMAVKASGFRLNQVAQDAAYVVVDAAGIRDWYAAVDLSQDSDFEKESVAVAKGAIVSGIGPQGLRPSVEAGFHALLGPYVLHTHAVQANLLCCSREGERLVKEIFTDAGFPSLWIPYINPGFCLTLQIRDARAKMIRETGEDPHIVFMENHGLIVWGDDAEATLALHDAVNDRILLHFGMPADWTVPAIRPDGEDGFVSGTPEVKAFLAAHKADMAFFEAHPLYPDQLVYLNAGMLGSPDTRKIDLDAAGGIRYRTGEAEALAMEETLAGFVWVMTHLETAGLTRKTMSAADVDFIRNWESEAYRRSLVQKMTKA